MWILSGAQTAENDPSAKFLEWSVRRRTDRGRPESWRARPESWIVERMERAEVNSRVDHKPGGRAPRCWRPGSNDTVGEVRFFCIYNTSPPQYPLQLLKREVSSSVSKSCSTSHNSTAQNSASLPGNASPEAIAAIYISKSASQAKDSLAAHTAS